MEAKNYRIVFKGQLQPDHKQETVRHNFARLFKISEAQLNQMFSGKPVILKKGLSRNEARHYEQAIARAGAHCLVMPVAEPETRTKVYLKPDPPQTTTRNNNSPEQQEDPIFPERSLPKDLQPAPDTGFNTRGRMGRAQYACWGWGGVLLTTLAAMLLLTTPALHSSTALSETMLLLALLCCSIGTLYMMMLTMPRLHDLDHSGLMSLLLVIPLLNLALLFYTTLAKGSPGTNQYGSQPAAASQAENLLGIVFPLICLALIVAASVYYLPILGSMIMQIMPLERTY
ncbi:DUF805 domain-containing protein [Endozoicomonadaceae bacterium StTr2]